MLFIKWLWIDEAYRGHGHGRKLMASAEEEGRRRGCTAVWLDTFEFQARPFYEKLGYSSFGTLDYPAGFKRFFLQKSL
jgi:GNAT superfamily N-acetyltransferase